jgi:hypothetical protein
MGQPCYEASRARSYGAYGGDPDSAGVPRLREPEVLRQFAGYLVFHRLSHRHDRKDNPRTAPVSPAPIGRLASPGQSSLRGPAKRRANQFGFGREPVENR